MTKPESGEAAPPNNTAKINPLTFDEAALAKALQKMSLAEAEPPREPPPEAAPPEGDEPAVPELPGEPAGEPEGEPEQPPPGDQTDEGEEEDSHDGVQKRINKLTAQKKEAQEKAEALEREVNELKSRMQTIESAPPAVPSAATPFSNVWEENKLREQWEEARNLKRWCEDNVDGTTLGDTDYSSEEIRRIKRNVEDALELQIPQRAAFLHQFRQIKPEAEKVYPFWKDRNSPLYAEAQVVLKQLPQLAQLPNYQVLIGDFLAGQALRTQNGKQVKPGMRALPPKAPRQPATPSGGRVDESRREFDARKKKFLKTGGVDELAHVLKDMV